jgi:A/G-specific adenine glycosylase
MVPPGRGWQFGQALIDLGAAVCTAGTPLCHQCPIRRRCRWSRAGRGEPDPAQGSAGVSTPQSVFGGSDRQGRGRLIDALRGRELTKDQVAAAAGWPDDPGRADRIVAGLLDDGLVARDRLGVLRLP